MTTTEGHDTVPSRWARLRGRAQAVGAAAQTAANAPWDASGLAAFRVLFGGLMFVGHLRFLLNGWVDRFFVKPSFYFSYWGFEWVEVLSPLAMHVAVAGLCVLSLCIALGLFYRVATVVFFVLFTYVELIDVTNYLNHYYLVSLLALLLCFLPLHRAHSLDARRKPSFRVTHLPAWMTWLLRFQVGVVYFYAGLAKLGPDWLLHAQPLNIWLSARTDTAIIGPYLDRFEVALAMSWAGFLFDTTIPFWLLWRRSRPFAYAAVVGFHIFTGVFFAIGMFPFIMVLSATIFFSPSWPRKVGRLLARWRGRSPPGEPVERPYRARAPGWLRGAGAVAITAWCLFHVAMPLRTHLYGGDVLWHEQGMRWAWKVMVREKNGSVTYHVHLPDEGRRVLVHPRQYLTAHQEREMSGQPDLILQLAHHIAADFRARGHREVEVRAEALVSLNGRTPEHLIDPEVDLTRVADGIARADWIRPAPSGPPIRLEPPTEGSWFVHR